MKTILLLLTMATIINPSLHAPHPQRAHHLYAVRRTSQLPHELLIRPVTPRPDRSATPPRLDYAVNMTPMSPEEVHVEEVRAQAIIVRAMSKKKIACLVAATAITSSILTAAVALTIQFASCDK